MPFVPGIKRLSRLVIDVSKDWASRRILNLGVPTAEGDALRKGTRLSMGEMPDGPSGHVLTGQGAGLDPVYKLHTAPPAFPAKLKVATERWVKPGWYAAGSAEATMVAGRIYYIPIFVAETTTYIRIGCYVRTAASGTADLRIFNWSDGLPSTQVLAAGTVPTWVTGLQALTISQQLTRGYYFLAIRCTAAPILSGLDILAAVVPPVSGFGPGGEIPPGRVILTASATFADPAPPPTSATIARFAVVDLREN